MAVALVVAYHLAPDLVPGGFLGVDVFFVLSGFLITSLLLAEVGSSGRVDLGAFYLRRFRRLAPALLLLLVALAAYAAVLATPGELARLREHSLWTLGYLANWRFVSDGTTYTDLVVGESPLRHTWSLAIEEQFYVVFPALVLLGGRMVGWAPAALRRVVLVGALGGVVASAAWMAALWGDGADPSRGYFGTDTRAHSLLVGVALGAVLVGRPPRVGRPARIAAVAGPMGVLVLALAVALSEETAGWLHKGGFLAVAVAVAAVIAALERMPWLQRLLSVRPLVALGVISYGVYLWHWPVVVLASPGRTGIDGPLLLVARLGLTLGLAVASYVLVERPIRHGELGRRLPRLAPAAATGAVVAVLAAVVVSTTSALPEPQLVSAAPAVREAPASDPAEPRAVAAEPATRVLVLGDSVAHTLAGGVVADFPSFEPWAPEQSPFDPAAVDLWSVARPACSFLPGEILGAGSAVADLSSFCGDWRADLDAALGAHDSDLVLVALANDVSDRRVDGTRVDLGAPAHEELLHDFLAEVEAIARRHGAHLGLIPLPERVGAFVPEEPDGRRREVLMRQAYLDFASARRDVRIFDLFGVICPGDDCGRPPPGYDPSWRYDGWHFSAAGSRWVADWLAGEIRSDR